MQGPGWLPTGRQGSWGRPSGPDGGREAARVNSGQGRASGGSAWASGGLGFQLKTSVKDRPPSRYWVLVEAQHLHCGEIQGGNQLGGQQVLGG